MKKLFVLFCLFFSFGAQAAEHKLNIVTSTSILADMAKVVGGNKVDVYSIIGPDVDVHSYEPTPHDIKKIANADLIILNGLGLDDFALRLVKSSGTKAKIATVTKGVNLIKYGQMTDPHAWQSLKNAVYYARNIEVAICEQDKPNDPYYEANTEKYIDELKKLDVWALEQISKIAPEKRKILTPHDAFKYFERDYGIKFISPEGIHSHGGLNAKNMAKIIKQAKANKVSAIFLENIADTRTMQQIAKESGIKIGGKLYSDSLSKPDATTYANMFKYNVLTLIAALK
jgi:zinc/manganese transport system substrate-binding protein